MSMKNSNVNIGNRTRNVPACSAVRLRRKEIEVTNDFRKNKQEKDETDCAGKGKSSNLGRERK
jgi:hypothetical protein